MAGGRECDGHEDSVGLGLGVRVPDRKRLQHSPPYPCPTYLIEDRRAAPLEY